MPRLSLPLLSFVFLIIALPASAQQGRVLEEETLKSATLNRPVQYGVYLPPGYESSQRTYPVVYLLHGYGDDHTGWVQFGEINRYADRAISEGKIPPMVIVMPDADSTWYMNDIDGKQRYEDFFIREFIPAVEKKYRIKSQKMYRGIAGLSMGGFGTLSYSLKYPDLFAAAAPLSAAVWDDSALVKFPDPFWNTAFGIYYGKDLKGKARLNKYWYAHSILNLVKENTTENLSKVRYWIDCGDDDFLTAGNCLLHIALTEKNIPHEFRVREGGHSWGYWRSGITDALEFIGESFHQK